MNYSILKTTCGLALSGMVLATPAAAAVTITGGVNSVTVASADPGLVITASPVAFPSFVLNNVGDFRDFTVLTIGTNESSVELDDLTPLPISVAFRFTNPAGTTGAPIIGTTVGFYELFSSCGILAGGCGTAVFNAPSVFSFGQGGRFSVALSSATFATPGTANVTGRFTLVSAPVPEPSTWAMLVLGFGAIGGAMRSRRTAKSVRVNYA